MDDAWPLIRIENLVLTGCLHCTAHRLRSGQAMGRDERIENLVLTGVPALHGVWIVSWKMKSTNILEGRWKSIRTRQGEFG